MTRRRSQLGRRTATARSSVASKAAKSDAQRANLNAAARAGMRRDV